MTCTRLFLDDLRLLDLHGSVDVPSVDLNSSGLYDLGLASAVGPESCVPVDSGDVSLIESPFPLVVDLDDLALFGL